MMRWARLLIVLALAGGSAGPVTAADPPTEPLLRIDGSEHAAVILGLAVSTDGKQLATASYDRTVRLWSLPALDPVRTIHLPIGPGIEGAAYTVAFSPDGKTLATGGWTGSWSGPDGPWCVYVVALDAGDITRTICDLPRRVNHIAFSRDGTSMALALKLGGGIRVYRTADWGLALEDRNYGETSTFVEFDAAGRLASTCYDGKVRLYDADLKLIATGVVPDGRKPDSVAFSPDGTRIAVAYSDPEANDPLWPPAVDVLSGSDLTVMFRPDLRGVDNGTLWRAIWSADGRFLYAAGTWQKAGRFPVRRWADGGRGRPVDIAAATSPVMRLRSLPDGGAVLAGEIPYLAVIGANDRVVAERRAAGADFNEIGDRLAVSADGLTVQFAYERAGRSPAWFSLAKRQIETGEAPAELKLAGAVTDHPTLDVRDWQGGYTPTLNGAPLALQTHDNAFSLSIAPDAKSLLLGSKTRISAYDDKAKRLWATQVPFNAHGVVITGDGRLVVGALGDGTVRWYAMDTGRELLALFVHRDGQHWVAWTPSGYYMASVGGDALIGWQVNRGRDHVADFFSVGRFSDKYYRPDIVEKILTVRDEERAIREADAEGGRGEQRRSVAALLPPVIELIDPPTKIDSAEITLKFRVRTPSGEPIEEITVRNDGHALGHYDSPILDNHGEGEGDLPLIVPQRDTELLVFARNRFATSEPARVRLTWSGNKTAAASEPQRTLYLLAIGVSAYKDPKLQLGFAAKDAGDFVEAVKRQTSKAFSKVVPRVLTDDKANLAGIREGLTWLGTSAQRDDIGVIFLAGHGFDDRDGTYYYLPHEADVPRLSETALPYRDLLDGLKAIKGHAMLFIDTCHAGDVIGRPGKASMDVIGLVSRLSQPSNGVIVYASSTGDQYSMEASIWRNGAFTKAVVEGLDGAAEYRKRTYITTSMLETYVKERVKDLTASRQTPTVNMPLAVPDLLLARIGSGG